MTREENPYTPPADVPTRSRYVSRHEWRGRTITVEGNLLASRLFLVERYAITIDGKERFETSQVAAEEFTFEFQHQDRPARGRFRRLGFNNGIVQKYELSLDDEPLGTFRLWMREWWMLYTLVILLFLFVGVVALVISLVVLA